MSPISQLSPNSRPPCRRESRIRWRTSLAASLALVASLACASSAQAQSQPQPQSQPAAARHEIRFAVSSDTPTSMPGSLLRNTATDNILAHVVESLVALRADLSIGPMLADRWDISADGKTYTFHLRHGVQFHNGKPMTAADVKWSYEYFMNPSTGFYCRRAYDGHAGAKVLGVHVVDRYTVTFDLDRASALFLNHMADPRCPLAVLSPDSVDAEGHWSQPIGTGPYVFADWQPGQYVLLKPFAAYRPRQEPANGSAGAKVAHADVRFVTIPDETAQMSALMSGQIDAMNLSEQMVPPKDPAWHVVAGPGADPAMLLIQSRDPLLADVRIRRAIALAADLPGIANAVTEGRSDYNPSLVPNASALASPATRVGYVKSLPEVKRLLDDAGYHGQPITLETNRRYTHMFTMAVYLQSLLARAGINVKLQVVEWGKQLADYRAGRFQLMAFGYTARTDPALMYADVLGDKSRNALVQWEDPAALDLLRSIAGETDDRVRARVFGELHQRMLADVPMLVLYNSPDLMLVSSRLHGVTSWPIRLKRFYNVTKD
ncbi:ABC transporter substrate-binding protein [Pandoraea norimbergensis]|uniref:ABC transporter substrate-binding protein n=1 Tax=Pandoraea norimbergensis TaxID=93219 RepID=A0ABM5WQ53_9BURK|nr:ABC transporter substrate-binding protein [Pandoraea norimbergensis]ALS62731.1 ABC transporter substrate-binding protein [Pandoraea norimbergensis]